MNEDKREAVNIGITISSQLISAALAMITVLGAFAVFIIDKREVHFWYYFLAGLSFISFVASIVAGGKGINKARVDGYSGNWYIHTTKDAFNWQALFCLAGLIFFITSIFIGKEKSTHPDQAIQQLTSQIDSLRTRQYKTERTTIQLQTEYLSLKEAVDSIRIKSKTTDTNYSKKSARSSIN
ncbi:hypothetical protein [Chitinophaga agri]|uniref:Uncharacterized protein n=1 Tax=Chitinophaga agri TaxID=2703787 RepID=A0A6B9ZFR3_9BACT|nr:hypothetical protein [Chitinophaga agri]QHS59925.1 hypothetical protein GWR21_10075 [Chitinophaga agri]